MNSRIITKNHADDSKIGSPLKIDFKSEWTHESMPTAWELKDCITRKSVVSCLVVVSIFQKDCCSFLILSLSGTYGSREK